MSKQIVAGNWKMNLEANEADKLLQELIKLEKKFNKDTEVIICPSAPYLGSFAKA